MACLVCQEVHSQRTESITLQSGLHDLVARASQKKLLDFYKYVNSFLNEKGGTIVIHATNVHDLEQFDQKVDKKLDGLIPDGSLYQSKFERSYFDPNHLVYRIKPSEKNRPLSTFDFKTKVSSNKGLEPPSYTQMTCLIDRLCKDADSCSDESDSDCELTFTDSEEVFQKRKHWDEPFQENLKLQAKLVPSAPMPDLANYCWDKLKEYISSFTKVRQSCSLFFGVGEHKLSEDEWVEFTPNVVALTDSGRRKNWKIWKLPSASETNQDGVYFVSKAAKKKEKQTGVFKTVAFRLSKQDRISLENTIQKKAKEELKWVGQQEPKRLFQFEFHPVFHAPHPDYCVFEVKIAYYHGLCFHDREGPELYRCEFQHSGANHASLKRVSFREWVDSFKDNAHSTLKEWPIHS